MGPFLLFLARTTMWPSSSSSDPAPEDNPDVPEGDDRSGRAASDPEEARAAAEDALAQIEEMADLDEESEVEPTAEEGTTQATSEDVYTESSAGGSPEDQCENCGALLHGPYCSQCGQKAADRIVPIWHMINEALEAVIELDLRVIYTFPKFLFMPGRLTKEYINGRRKRYIRPFRLYLFATFVLFTVLALSTGGSFSFPFNPDVSSAQADTVAATARGSTDTTALTGATGVAPAPAYFGSREQREEWARQLRRNPNTVDVQIGDPETQSQLERFLRVKVAEAIENPRDFVGSLIDRGPYIMFMMLPLFAFLLKLLYIRRRRLYVEHLIFSLHVHAFAFIAFTIGILMGQSGIPWVSTIGGWVDASPLLYLVVAMGHVYDQGIIKSSLKAFFLLTVYTIILTFGLIFGALAAVVFM